MRSSGQNPTELGTSTAAGKVLALLDAFGPEQPDFSLAELSARAQLPKSTTHRLLTQLQAWGGIERTASGRYRFAIKMFELGGLVPDRLRLREIALPFMEDLLAATREIVHLARLEGTDVLYVERLTSHLRPKSPSRVAGRVPASCTAVGKAILAFSPDQVVRAVLEPGLPALTPYSITDPHVLTEHLAEIRRQGLAFDREEAALGLVCVAAPVFAYNGHVVAAVSASGRSSRFSPETAASAVRTTSLGISRGLGFRMHTQTTETGLRSVLTSAHRRRTG